MIEWKEYTGSDEQIAEMLRNKTGFLIRLDTGEENIIRHAELLFNVKKYLSNVTHYWLIPADPLREMKIRQAMTKQPTWIRHNDLGGVISMTTSPDWNIPNAEYSFTTFED